MTSLEDRIKWRGKSFLGDKTRWCYGALCYISNTIAILRNCRGSFFVVLNTVGQYTEYKDRNDKEIYEGDIVKNKGTKFIVIYSKSFRFLLQSIDTPLCKFPLGKLNAEDIIIIGNKYDNPELINNEMEDSKENH